MPFPLRSGSVAIHAFGARHEGHHTLIGFPTSTRGCTSLPIYIARRASDLSVAPILTGVDWLEIVGWTGSALLVWSLLQTRILRLRLLNLIGCLALIGYNAAVRVWPMVGLNVVLAVINVVYLRRMLVSRHDERAYDVVEVDTGSAFLAHLLRVHGEDIARFNPGFTPDLDGPDRCAFLVLLGDEVVGVVLVRAVTPELAQVELDYVTLRFRDFTPGEFVFRRSQLFTDRGFRTVLTPPGMLTPYYGRLGLRREGDHYVLDL
jgi:hypothetical protein